MGTFEPIYLKKEDIEEVSSFLELDFKYCKNRILDYKIEELKKEWEKVEPVNEEEIRRFYSTTDLYIWELTQWHNSSSHKIYEEMKDTIVREYPPCVYPSLLDYGCGIGSESIYFAEAGYNVTAADIPSKTFEFAKYRTRKRKLNVTFIPTPVKTGIPRMGKINIIVLFDVLEHIPNPRKILSFLRRNLLPEGIMVIAGPPNIKYKGRPYHLYSNQGTLSGEYWALMLDNVGLKRVGNCIYQKRGSFDFFLRKMRYLFWKSTGMYITHLPRWRKNA